jgi:hypothetical protein
MRTLYHFTRERHLPGIAKHGLVPAIRDETIPAVWLTADENPLGWLRHFHDDACCLTVRPRNGELFHWRTWLAGVVGTSSLGERIVGAEVLATLDRDRDCRRSIDSFYVHLGTIPRDRIKLIEPIQWNGEDEEINASIRGHQEKLRGFDDEASLREHQEKLETTNA